MSAEAPQWYIRSRGRTLGPFRFAQLETMRDRGQLSKFHEVSRDRKDWGQAGNVAELFPSAVPRNEFAPVNSWPEEERVRPEVEGYSVSAPDPPSRAGRAPAEEEQWYHFRDNAPVGPISYAELGRLLRSGEIGPESMIYTQSLPDWTPARQVPGLRAELASPSIPEFSSTLRVNSAPSGETALVAPRLSGLAVAGLVLGVFGLLCPFLLFPASAISVRHPERADITVVVVWCLIVTWAACGPLALILGSVGMARTGKASKGARGFGMALTGMILGILSTLGLLPFLALIYLGLIVAVSRA